MIMSKGECRIAQKLNIKKIGAIRLTDEEQEFVDAHINRCDLCQAEHHVLSQMSHPSDLPDFLTEEFSRRLFISNTLKKADRKGKPQESPEVYDRRGLFRLVQIAAGIAAFIGVSVFLWASSPTGSLCANSPLWQLQNTQSTILLSNEQDPVSLSAGSSVKPNQTIKSNSEYLAFSVTPRILTLLSPRSTVKITQMDENNIHLTLIKGTLTSSVTPTEFGQTLTVSALQTQIEVLGTVFSMSATDSQVEVNVLRGKIRLDEVNGQSRIIKTGYSWTNQEITSMTQEVHKTLWKRLYVLDLLSPSAQSTVLAIETVPSGADVYIDNLSLGKTPLSAQMRTGLRRLRISKEGYETIEELIEGRAGTQTEHTFILDRKIIPKQIVVEPINKKSVNSTNQQRVTPTASELLSQSQKHKTNRNWQLAADAYNKLIRRYPKSGEAKSAKVSYGKLLLYKLRQPLAALKQFDNYLSHGGPLTQEALYGKSKALKALGRTNSEKRVLETFIKTFPHAIQLNAARARVLEIEKESTVIK